MKPLRFIPIFIAALAFVFVQALPAQVEKAAEAVGQTTKKAGKKVKDTAEKAGEKTGKAVQSTTEPANTTPTPTTTTTPETHMTKKAKAAGSANRAVPTVSESEIAAAKASGKVWVNTETGVYHKSGQWYGATKQGKFMTEDEAIKAGYRAEKPHTKSK